MPKLNPVDAQVGARIAEIRKQKRVTQASLARSIGVTFQQVQKYEKGANRVSGSRLLLVADALGTTVNDVLGRTNPEVHPGTDMLLEHWARIEDPIKRDAVLKIVASLAD